MNKFLHPVMLSAVITLFSLVLPGSGQAELRYYVKKYQRVEVPKIFLNKIKSYDHLVKYFSSFAYFVPRHQVNPYFIHALILAESSGNPRAISPKKAYGLGQIILSTAKIAGEELANSGIKFKYIRRDKLKNLRKSDLFNPAINILLTCYLIAKYNYKFNGQLELVLTAWNAGEYTKHLRYGKHAPYKETENLIGKVNGYYNYLLKNR